MDTPLPPTTPILKELSPKHKQVCALLAQGVDRKLIAGLVDFTPEYITWLQRQPLIKEYLATFDTVVERHLKSLAVRSIQVIQDKLSMDNVSDDLALGAMNGAAKALGFGAHNLPAQAVQFVVQLPGKAASSAEWEASVNRKEVPNALDASVGHEAHQESHNGNTQEVMEQGVERATAGGSQ